MKFLLSLFIALVCFASQLKADVPSIIWNRNFGGEVSSLSLHPSGNYLLVGGIWDSVYTASVVNPENGKTIKGYVNTSTFYTKFSPKGNYVGLGGWCNDNQDGKITIIDFATDSIIFQKLFIGSVVYGFDISPDESLLVVGRDGWMDFYNLPSGERIDSIKFFISPYDDPEHAGNKAVFELTYSPDGKYISYFSEISGGIIIMNAETHKVVYSKNTNTAFGKIAFSPDGKTVAFTDHSGDTYLEILNLDSMKIVDNLTEHWMGVDDIIFTKDSKNMLLSGGASLPYLKRYDLNTKILNIISKDWNSYGSLCLSQYNDTLFYNVGSVLQAENIAPYLYVNENNNIPELSINLNLSQSILNLSFPILAGKEFLIRIANIEGQVVKTFGAYSTSDNFNGVYDINDLASGSYILSVQGAGVNASSKFIISR